LELGGQGWRCDRATVTQRHPGPGQGHRRAADRRHAGACGLGYRCEDGVLVSPITNIGGGVAVDRRGQDAGTLVG